MECKIKGTEVYYESFGRGTPILMIHGIYPDHRLLKGCMEPLFKGKEKDKWLRLYPDLPGMGKTKGSTQIKNSDHMLETLLQFTDKMIPNQKFLVVGESYGGYLTRGMLHHRQDQIDGICLICPLIIPNQARRKLPPPITLVNDSKLLEKLTVEEQLAFEPIAVVQNQRTWERFNEEIYAGLKLADEWFLCNLQQTGYAFSFDVDALKTPFNKPALFLMGRQDHIVGYKDACRIVENYKRCTFAVLDRAGHNLQIEQEDCFNTLVKDWLFRVQETAAG